MAKLSHEEYDLMLMEEKEAALPVSDAVFTEFARVLRSVELCSILRAIIIYPLSPNRLCHL